MTFAVTENGRTVIGMDDYIKREALRDALYDADAITMNGVKILNQFPSSDVEPVKHGRWEWFEEWSYSTPEHSAECDDCGWRCSECKTKLEDMVNGYYDDSYEVPQLNYCPNCGARMDGE